MVIMLTITMIVRDISKYKATMVYVIANGVQFRL